MADFRVGCVPYLNARPLVYGLETREEVSLTFDTPSRLAQSLETGELDVAMVSSLFALSSLGTCVVGGVSISSRGKVESVRLFSKVPFGDIRTLALDQSSLSSNALCRIVLAEMYGVRPEETHAPPDLAAMLEQRDAALLIGDPGMRAQPPEGVFVLDLGKAWEELTDRPFVWAAWIGFERVEGPLAAILFDAKERGKENLEAIALREAERSGWPLALCRRYLIEVMDYELDTEHLEALMLFGELCVRHSILPRYDLPAIVGGLPTG